MGGVFSGSVLPVVAEHENEPVLTSSDFKGIFGAAAQD